MKKKLRNNYVEMLFWVKQISPSKITNDVTLKHHRSNNAESSKNTWKLRNDTLAFRIYFSNSIHY